MIQLDKRACFKSAQANVETCQITIQNALAWAANAVGDVQSTMVKRSS